MTFYNQNNFQKSLNDFISNIPSIDYVKNNKSIEYANIAMSFDIETTSFYENDDKKAIMYIWQFGINDNVILGRYWVDFELLLKTLKLKFNLSDKRYFIIYVHNLSYEFQFIRKRFIWNNVFMTDERKPLYCEMKDSFIFKDSYRLSGYSLETVGKNLYKHNVKKLVGDLDYSRIRNSKTELSDKELEYCVNDILVVNAYIDEQIDEYQNIINIPMTQTGKVRRLVKKNCFADKNYRYQISKMKISNELEYLLLRKSFAGGFTHSNYCYTNEICKNVTSYDFTSSYPTVMVTEKFPMSSGKYIKEVSNKDYEEFYSKEYCCIFDIKIYNLKPTSYENIISLSKCTQIQNETVNNGRVSSCDFLVTTITNIDFDNIRHFYTFSDYSIRNLYIYDKKYLPKPFIETVLKLYSDKTQLKGVKGKEVEYLHSKEMLNSLYGMTVTALNSFEYIYENNEYKTIEKDYIDSYNNNKNRFSFYAWGVFITAYARKNLYSGIIAMEHNDNNEYCNDYIYSDTDSIKIFNADKHTRYFDNYNAMIRKKLKNMCDFYNIDYNLCKPKTINGIEKILGVWDFDGHYQLFKTLGAKRYITLNDDNELSLTVAGVNKKFATPWLLDKYKNDILKIFSVFKDGLTIPRDYSGKKTLTYIDNEINGNLTDYNGISDNYKELSCIHMENSEYKMNMAIEYIKYLLKYKTHYEF